jgi:ribosome modulation factor
MQCMLTGIRLVNRLVIRFGLFGLLVLSQGCATLSKQDCETADWTKIGHDDGYQGKPHDEFLKHQAACKKHGIQANLDVYKVSYSRAMVEEYCTESRGYKLGSEGRTYKNVCPKQIESEFLKGYLEGKKDYRIRKERERAAQRHDEKQSAPGQNSTYGY